MIENGLEGVSNLLAACDKEEEETSDSSVEASRMSAAGFKKRDRQSFCLERSIASSGDLICLASICSCSCNPGERK